MRAAAAPRRRARGVQPFIRRVEVCARARARRAAACAAYPAWKEALTQPFFEELAKSVPALATYEITDPFVSKHMRKTPKGT